MLSSVLILVHFLFAPIFSDHRIVVGDARVGPECAQDDATDGIQANRKGETHIGVQCCKQDGTGYRQGFSNGENWGSFTGCLRGVTFTVAKAACASNGDRLCTAQEIIAKVGYGTGCNFNRAFLWTSSLCGNVGMADFEDSDGGFGAYTDYSAVELVGGITCGQQLSGYPQASSDGATLYLYEFVSDSTYSEVVLEGCGADDLDLWLYLYDSTGYRIYDGFDRYGCNSNEGCDGYEVSSCDMTVTSVEHVLHDMTVQTTDRTVWNGERQKSPQPITVSPGDTYYFGVGCDGYLDYGHCGWGQFTIKLLCDTDCVPEDPNWLRNQETVTWIVSYKSLFSLIVVSLVVLLVVNMWCMAKRNRSNIYPKVVRCSESSDSDSEAPKL